MDCPPLSTDHNYHRDSACPRVCSGSRSEGLVRLLLVFLGQTLLFTLGNVALSKPLTGFDDLDNVDPLFESHDGERDDCQDPRDGTIHLVGTMVEMVSMGIDNKSGGRRGQSYRAISIAPADQGLLNKVEGFCGMAGEPGCRDDGSGCNSEGVTRGEEKARRYRAMKKSSFKAQQTNKTFLLE